MLHVQHGVTSSRLAPARQHKHRRRCRAQALHRARFGPPDDQPEQQQLFTFFTADGLLSFPPYRPGAAPQRLQPLEMPLPTLEEQGLCVAATFWVAATNGMDPARRWRASGFCRSLEQVAEQVEHSVLRRGGEVMQCESRVSSGLSERLQMVVALPYLWGVPPEHEALKEAITKGGGIVHNIQRQWVWR